MGTAAPVAGHGRKCAGPPKLDGGTKSIAYGEAEQSSTLAVVVRHGLPNRSQAMRDYPLSDTPDRLFVSEVEPRVNQVRYPNEELICQGQRYCRSCLIRP